MRLSFELDFIRFFWKEIFLSLHPYILVMGQAFPLGTSDFRRIRELNRLYVDKTAIIEQLEHDPDFITFLRPRRFGKSLLVSTLSYYYDIKSANQFDKLFGDLYIGKHPTAEKNTYYILKLNFSELEFDDPVIIPTIFRKMIVERLYEFIMKYAPDEKQEKFLEILDDKNTLNTMLRRTLNNIAGSEGKVYVLIDEYDHFTNRMIFSELITEYKSAVQSSGYIRQFFTALKVLTEGPIKRIFITGILPILLNDITSGYNISKPVSTEIFYQGAMGFTEEEVKMILKNQEIYTDDLYLQIKERYNGFMFADDPEPTTPKAYNPQMTLSFIATVSKTGKTPINIINATFLSDKNKFDLFRSNPKNMQNILQILESHEYASTYTQILNLDALSDPNNLATFFFHFGLLTFHEYSSSAVLYKIPNLAMKELYYEYFKGFLRSNSTGFENMEQIYAMTKDLALQGDLQPLITYLQDEIISAFSFREPLNLNEKDLKFLLIMFFKFTPFYQIHSELELPDSANKGGYGDLILTKAREDVQVEWFFELKYVKFGNIKIKPPQPGASIPKQDLLKDKVVIKAFQEGKNQLERYRPIYEKKYRGALDTVKMRYVVILFVGKEFILFDEI